MLHIFDKKKKKVKNNNIQAKSDIKRYIINSLKNKKYKAYLF